MSASSHFVDRTLTQAQRTPTLTPADLPRAAEEAAALEADLQAHADHAFSQAHVADAVDHGAQLGAAAVDVGLAAHALHSIAQWHARKASSPSAARVLALHLQVAQSGLLRALRPLAKLPPLGRWPEADLPPASPKPRPAEAPAGTPPELEVLRNIAIYHRERERFHALDLSESAVALNREANRLRIIASTWMGEDPNASAPAPNPNIDFSLPAHQAAGCTDLNTRSAIAAIGVLFMEGGGEPMELKLLKNQLQAWSQGWTNFGQWVAERIDAAWLREQASYEIPAVLEVASARLHTVVTSWRGAREMVLAGRLLSLASQALQGMDFTPKALRSTDRQALGRRLLEVAWMLGHAAQVRARTSADLGENDRHWTAYLDGLPALK